ncbi:hypothetical protein CTAYLR_007025 [Chrysophaeum taylorii]|uniref:Nucleotide-diphospho-sugar transferase domain-containing protein n=1 Tax=Chrysophaeum taylorii TaxID=2483200 RepID=A0AAD7XFI1_9STRA|nr:hypothetical protein CTAYLR_007025 [Chrysophaeum taylorii]
MSFVVLALGCASVASEIATNPGPEHASARAARAQRQLLSAMNHTLDGKALFENQFPRVLHATAKQPYNLVLLTVADKGSLEFVANFYCNMKRIGVDYSVLASMDDKMYDWALRQGIPTFFSGWVTDTDATESGHDNEQYVFGSQGFRSVTKFKSLVVLELVKLNFTVLLSDVDVVWVRDPLSFFWRRLATQHMFIQSNSPRLPGGNRLTFNFSRGPVTLTHEDDLTLPNRLNSGIYLIPGTQDAISAMTEITNHAKASPYSEQPSFQIVLCKTPGFKVSNSSCFYERDDFKLTVNILDRMQFPSGAVFATEAARLIEDATVHNALAISPPLYALHYNWILGHAEKRRLIDQSNFWLLNHEGTTCIDPSLTKGESHSSL